MTMEELSNVQGRAWEDVDVSTVGLRGSDRSLTFDSIEKFTDERMREVAIEVECYSCSRVVALCSDRIQVSKNCGLHFLSLARLLPSCKGCLQ